MTPNTILFRADANRKLGLGHIVRCLALADALKNNKPDLEITFITKHEEGRKIIKGKNYKVVQVLDNEVSQIRNLANRDTLLITDFLDTNDLYISKIKKIVNLKIISIDNNTRLKKLDGNIVINANVFNKGEIKTIGSTRYFLGPKYMILRKGFEKANRKKEINNKVKSVLVMFGGTDPKEFIIKVASALKNIYNEVQVNLVIGSGFSYNNKFKRALSKMDKKFNLLFNPPNIIEIMENTDIAITAAGVVLYELATLGVPSLVIPQAKHQENIARAFEGFGAGINLGKSPNSKLIYKKFTILVKNRLLRERLSKNGKKLVDGMGTQRVIKLIKEETLK